MKTVAILAVLTVLTVWGCSPSHRSRAEQLYGEAVDAFSAKKVGMAKALIDSLKTYYADVPEVFREVRELGKVVSRYEIERTVAFLDSSLATVENKQRELLQDMVRENEDGTVAVYIAKSQQSWRAFSRCYIKARTDVNGFFTLTSNYVGENPISHNRLMVKSGEEYLTMPIVNDGVGRNKFEKDEYVWETVRYEGQEAADLAQFIAAHVTDRVAVDYRGEKSHYYTIMTDTDKEAVRKVWELSGTYRESRKIRSMLRSARVEMNRVGD